MKSSFGTGEQCPHLVQKKRDNYNHPIIIVQEELKNLIRALDISDEDRKSLVDFIDSAPQHSLHELGKQITEDVKAAERLLWEAKLEEFFESSPPKYETHKADYKNAPDMLKQVWGEYIKHNVLYLDKLTDYDDKLIPSVYRHWQLHGRSPDDKLPSPKQRRTDAIVQHVMSGPYGTAEILRAIRAFDRRNQRSRGI